jgi:hypothetical protein
MRLFLLHFFSANSWQGGNVIVISLGLAQNVTVFVRFCLRLGVEFTTLREDHDVCGPIDQIAIRCRPMRRFNKFHFIFTATSKS